MVHAYLIVTYSGLLKCQGPPEESINGEGISPAVLQAFDVWSLGCILSEVATWVVLGSNGVEKYRNHRRERLKTLSQKQWESETFDQQQNGPKIKRGDYFHDGNNVLDFVPLWHKFLRSCTRRCDFITGEVLDVVDSHLLVGDLTRRASIVQAYNLLQKVLDNDEIAGQATASIEISLPMWKQEFQRRVSTGSYELNLDS
jgi:hypothetical protein